MIFLSLEPMALYQLTSKYEGDDAVVGAVHDKGRLAKGWSVKGVVHLCDAHLLDHAEAYVLVVEGILLVVLDDGRVGANAVRQRVLELDEGLGGGSRAGGWPWDGAPLGSVGCR